MNIDVNVSTIPINFHSTKTSENLETRANSTKIFLVKFAENPEIVESPKREKKKKKRNASEIELKVKFPGKKLSKIWAY